jgi:hypothetical protein
MLDGFPGVIAREATGDTVSPVVPVIPLYVAVMVTMPVVVVAVANPFDPALLMSATAVFEDVQVTDEVMTNLLPFE